MVVQVWASAARQIACEVKQLAPSAVSAASTSAHSPLFAMVQESASRGVGVPVRNVDLGGEFLAKLIESLCGVRVDFG